MTGLTAEHNGGSVNLKQGVFYSFFSVFVLLLSPLPFFLVFLLVSAHRSYRKNKNVKAIANVLMHLKIQKNGADKEKQSL